MAERFPELTEKLIAFIGAQHVFFTASAAEGARINLSPREGAAFRVVDANTVIYLDRTGSGNETAAHLKADGRMTIMMCSFEGAPLILRLFGQGETLHRDSAAYKDLLETHFGGEAPPGARQIIRLNIELAQTSCGFGVPLYDYQEDRRVLERWAIGKKPAGIEAYWQEKNTHSMDGLPTGIFDAPKD